ncbi:protein transporter SEC9 [Hysterangium stoloniferum]|nr:protein transporter SEC9 [Hysterangium stoloniferum]
MSWFKRKDPNAIPPVNEQARSELLGTGGASRGGRAVSPGPPSTSPYAPSANSDPYARPAPARFNSQEDRGGGLPAGPAPPRDRYNRNNPVGDSYSRGRANLDQDRAELFAGYNPENREPSNRFTDGPVSSGNATGGDEEEDEVEGIKKQSRFIKQESVASTRNALRIAREAEETARNTLGRLGDQSEKLANTERHLDISKGHVNRVEDKQDELKQLNRSIFRPVITFNKEGKRAAQEAKLLQRHEDERDEHEKSMMDIRETQNRIGKAQTFNGDEEDEEGIGGYGSGRFKPPVDQARRKAERQRYQFEATASDDEAEDELDDNLNEISDMTKRLKALGSAMGQELDNQNSRLDRLSNKTDNLDNKLFKGTKRFERIK